MTTQTPFKYASVILDIAIDKSLDYQIPQELLNKVQVGSHVEIPLKGHLRRGFVSKLKENSSIARIQKLKTLLSETPILTPHLFQLATWMAKYYCTPLSKVVRTLLPRTIVKDEAKKQYSVKRKKTKKQLIEFCKTYRQRFPAQVSVLEAMLKVRGSIFLSELVEKYTVSRSATHSLEEKGFLSIEKIAVDRSPLWNQDYFRTQAKKLNSEQKKALEAILHSLNCRMFSTFLLYGVTGSGKTEIYLQAIEKALENNLSCIVLVPEIALTTQTMERFRSRFTQDIAILHHRLSHGERFDQWHKIREGKISIVVGARSAIFSPVKNLGLIIVDEEHEQSYKQSEEAPSYHAREIAVLRGKLEKACVVLGSATPSLESYHNAQKGKYQLLKLEQRADCAQMPTLEVVDMKKEFEKNKGSIFSEKLLDAIANVIQSGQQAILFLNRRGYYSMLMCPNCQEVIGCPHCSISLTFHRNDQQLCCHLCDYTLSPPPGHCPSCGSQDPMKFRGIGTEQVERSLHAIFPSIRTLRMDADTTKHKGSHEKLFKAFRTQKADVLIGTQMIAKGLHFPAVTLVGILNSDAALNIPDFRSSEYVFQLMTQVSGRAGRGSQEGKVLIQTKDPQNPIIQHICSQDFPKFFSEEIKSRQIFSFPPFLQMVKLSFSGNCEKLVEAFSKDFRAQLICNLPSKYLVHPVIPAGYAKIKNRFRFHFFIRGPNIYGINQAIEKVREKRHSNHVKIFINVNPTSTFF